MREEIMETIKVSPEMRRVNTEMRKTSCFCGKVIFKNE